jgi:hypothetical protein
MTPVPKPLTYLLHLLTYDHDGGGDSVGGGGGAPM